MSRYFLEVSYKGTHYSGFQWQLNANTIQAEVEKALGVLHKGKISLTGSSRTDTGVHALQNYFHFDYEGELHHQLLYKMNAILPLDICLKKIIPVKPDAHCRFDAVSREYKYFIYRFKDPFLLERAFYFPYTLDSEKLQQAASLFMEYNDFTSLSKSRTQVKNFNCNIMESSWTHEGDCLVYRVIANRFLRGMVRAMVATMLAIARGKQSLDGLRKIIVDKDPKLTNFAAPGKGLFLISVNYPDGYFNPTSDSPPPTPH